jgi:uncharacterized membrane protein
MRKVIFIVLLSLWIFQGSSAIAEIEAIFSSEGSIKESILKEVESTTATLELAIHDINLPDMANALLKAKQRGVRVRVIADSKQAKMKSSQITYLIHQGIMVKTLKGKEKGVMNDWTEASGKWNYENIVILTDGETVTFYQKEFDRLWREKRVIK